jgi:hypothetical protein
MIHATNKASLLLCLWNILESYGIDPAPLYWKKVCITSLNLHFAGI